MFVTFFKLYKLLQIARSHTLSSVFFSKKKLSLNLFWKYLTFNLVVLVLSAGGRKCFIGFYFTCIILIVLQGKMLIVCFYHVTYAFQGESTLWITTQLNHLASLARWLSVRLQIKWLWVRVQLQPLKIPTLLPSILGQWSTSTRPMKIYMDAGVSLLRFKYLETPNKTLLEM